MRKYFYNIRNVYYLLLCLWYFSDFSIGPYIVNSLSNFELSSDIIMLISSIPFIIPSILSYFMGILGDKYGRHIINFISFISLSICLMLLAYSGSILMIVLAVVFLGLSFSSFNIDSWFYDCLGNEELFRKYVSIGRSLAYIVSMLASYFMLLMNFLNIISVGLFISSIFSLIASILVVYIIQKFGRGIRGSLENIERSYTQLLEEGIRHVSRRPLLELTIITILFYSVFYVFVNMWVIITLSFSNVFTTYKFYAILMTTVSLSLLTCSRVRFKTSILLTFSILWFITFLMYIFSIYVKSIFLILLIFILNEICIGFKIPILIYLRNLYSPSSVRTGVLEFSIQISSILGLVLSYIWGLLFDICRVLSFTLLCTISFIELIFTLVVINYLKYRNM